MDLNLDLNRIEFSDIPPLNEVTQDSQVGKVPRGHITVYFGEKVALVPVYEVAESLTFGAVIRTSLWYLQSDERPETLQITPKMKSYTAGDQVKMIKLSQL
jgi:hypothetical protein